MEQKIKAEAARLGFSLCGFTDTSPLAEYHRYETWLEKGNQAKMQYLNSQYHKESRRDPTLLEPWVKSILCLAWPYPLHIHGTEEDAWVAGYAHGEDYHLLFRRKFELLKEFIRGELDSDTQVTGFVDSAPILERELASRAGLGWIGKNSCLVSPSHGSGLLLAELFIGHALQTDLPFKHDYCGSCNRCVEACPTGCINSDRTIDSNRCLSYLTIENKETFPEDLRSLAGNWFFGCDACQSVCPWNQKAEFLQSTLPNSDWSTDQLIDLLQSDSEKLRSQLQHSALYRPKWKGLVRNALVFLRNHPSQKGNLAIRLFIDNAPTDPDLLDLAIWAFHQILSGDKKDALQ